MLKGLAMVALLALAYGLMYLIFGKAGMERREREGKKNLGILCVIAMVLIFWALAAGLWIGGISHGDTVLCIVITFAVPILFAMLAVVIRKKERQRGEEHYELKGDSDFVAPQETESEEGKSAEDK